MWEKIDIWERGRIFGMVFFCACVALLGYILLLVSFSAAAKAVGILAALLGLTFVSVRIVRHFRYRQGRPPVGPLSSDERLKARAKLINPRPGKH